MCREGWLFHNSFSQPVFLVLVVTKEMLMLFRLVKNADINAAKDLRDSVTQKKKKRCGINMEFLNTSVIEQLISII